MNPHHSSAALQFEILYGSDTFQVRLLHLSPGETQPSYPQPPATHSQIFVIDGPLNITANAEIISVGKGQRLASDTSQPIQLSTLSSQPVSLIESRWGKGFEPLPLGEVTETRPWGSFTILKDQPDYKLKQLAVNPGNRLSLQRHQQREEHWLVTAGYPEVTLDDAVIKLAPGEYIHIPRHSWHRISNPAGNEAVVEIIELQLGDYFGEDDIERRQDDYGRS